MRTLRRSVPRTAIDFMLDRGIYLRAGRDTRGPEGTAKRYADRAARVGVDIAGKVVCVVGYGGGFGVGIQLLEQGAARVILQDPFAPARPTRNATIPPALRQKYFRDGRGRAPDRERIEVVHDDLALVAQRRPGSADVVVSNSVLEHVADVPSVVSACARITSSAGINIHYIDLKDHYFKHPFEMLCYSERTWRRWLNTGSNLNRLRLPDFQRRFAAAFETVDVEVLKRLVPEFRRVKRRVRPEFLTGDEGVDTATSVCIEARGPRRG